ncbi:MAG: signal peptidase I [Phycisphaerae bacterium]|nr:signal peptidase I [Phycisphaerae bacterium]
MIVLAILGGVIIVSLVFQTFAMWLSTRICRVPGVGISRAVIAVLLITAIGLGITVATWSLGANTLAMSIFTLALNIALQITLFRWLFRTGIGKATLVWLLMIGIGVSLALPGALILRAKVLESFIVSAGSMHPTIRGPHIQTTCPKCKFQFDAPLAVEWHDLRRAPVVCPQCHDLFDAKGRGASADRFMVYKLDKPKRWDIVAFRNPLNQRENYIKRLVGLPGETVEIANGEVVINGRPEPKPAGLDVKYLAASEIKSLPSSMRSLPARVTLGENEYYMLGDNTEASSDSRFWGTQGKARDGAIPGDLFIGVVRLTYWPPSRWRTF